MSAPTDDHGFGDPLRYAPPWARRAGPDRPAEPDGDAPAPLAPAVDGDPGRPEPPAAGPPADAEAVAPDAETMPAAPPREPPGEPEPPAAAGHAPVSSRPAEPVVAASPVAPPPVAPSPVVTLPVVAGRAVDPPVVEDAPATVPQPGDPGGFGWLRTRPFAGDIAMRELTRRLALDPHLQPEPPQPEWRPSRGRGAVVLAALCGVAAAVALVLVLVLFPGPDRALRTEPEGGAPLAGSTADRALVTALERTPPVRLVLVELRRAGRGEPVGLGVGLTRGLGDGSLMVSGLVPGARLTAGTALAADRWRVPLGELGRAAVVPPRDFAGIMDLTLELRLADDSVGDRSAMRIAWGGAVITPLGGEGSGAAVGGRDASGPPLRAEGGSAAPAGAVAAVDPEEVAILLDRGKAFLARGDLAAARLLLRRAAEAGDAQAALLLGSSFDPVALKQLDVVGAVADSAQARAWYQRAAELGSADAARRLDGLGGSAR
jgi:hypothetical protein